MSLKNNKILFLRIKDHIKNVRNNKNFVNYYSFSKIAIQLNNMIKIKHKLKKRNTRIRFIEHVNQQLNITNRAHLTKTTIRHGCKVQHKQHFQAITCITSQYIANKHYNIRINS